MLAKVSIKENLELIRQRIKQAGADPNKIKLVAAVKTLSPEQVEEALQAGITDIGDNKVQEAKAKAELKEKYPQVQWHMIGHLQRNKVRQALPLFDIIQSVDSERLAREIDEQAQKKVPILIEVNTSGEESKYGVPADQAIDLLKIVSKFANIAVQGLMTIAPLVEDPEQARPCFVRLRQLSEEITALNLPNTEMKYLSMGMTDDFEVAIQEGANIIRLGRALFGPACRQAGKGEDKDGRRFDQTG